jgi:hypothetical protein
MVIKAIKLLLITELIILATNFISFDFFINFQVAFLSSFLIILGSTYAYRKMIKTQVAIDNTNEKRDFLDEIEDPHELFDDTPINDTPVEELDLKAIVKEEKKKIKILNIKDIKKGSKAGFSPYRLFPYIFLILGFIALKNNELLDIAIYLPSLLAGIIIGYVSSKD